MNYEDNPRYFIKNQMVDRANDQIQQTLANMRDEVERMNQVHDKQLTEARDEQRHNTARQNNLDGIGVDAKPEQTVSKFNETTTASSPHRLKPLVYFSYPVTGFHEIPAWVLPLKEALCSLGYLVYSPGEPVGQQFGKPDLPYINALDKKVTKPLCSVLSLPDDLLLPYEAVARLILSGDQGEPSYVLFKHLWFLVRSSLLVVDLTRPSYGSETGQELLYAKQLRIPTLGVPPENGSISPWVQRSITALLTAEFNLNNMIPLVKGYAPC